MYGYFFIVCCVYELFCMYLCVLELFRLFFICNIKRINGMRIQYIVAAK